MGLASRIPRRVGGSGSALPTPNPSSAIWVDDGYNYDVAIGGLPFILATDPNHPMQRATADYRKQQIDSSAEPGEQSIVQWWEKSQSTFHLGAGQKYIDTPSPGNEAIRPLRYQSSVGVNPWTIGQVSLLSQTTRALTSSTATLLTADADGSATRFLVAQGATLTRVTETVSAGVPTYTSASLTWGGSGTILALTTDGTYYYAANSNAVYRGPLTGASPGSGAAIYTLPTGTTSIILGWVKARLVALVNVGGGSPLAQVFTLLSQPASPPAAMPTANYTHPNTNWVWSALTEGPSAIYASGSAGNRSEILRFTLDTSGAMPTLSGAATAATFPPSEIVQGMVGYLGTVIGVSTTRGFRVGTFVSGSNGDLALGPLSVRNLTLTGGTTGSDRFFYAAGTHDDGTAGLFRVDTSQQVSERQFSYTPNQEFGWASDLRAADSSELPVAGAATACAATADGRVGFLVPGFGLYVQHPSQLVPSGSLTTSRIRFGTLDPKLFRFVRIRGDHTGTSTDSGSISVTTSLTDTGGQTAGTLFVALASDSGDLAANLPAAVSAVVIFGLNRSGSDATVGPTLNSYQLKALPAQRRQRQIILPLMCFDHEQDSGGSTLRQDGSALSRLQALEAIENAGDIVTLQWLGAFPDQNLTESIVIDKMEFDQVVSPGQSQNWGGIIMASLRTVT